MANIMDYIKWRGDLPFKEFPANEVDGLVFCAFSYICFPEMVKEDFSAPARIVDLAEHFFSLPEKDQEQMIRNETDKKLLKLMAEAPRYKDVTLMAYHAIWDTEQETQFAAYTLQLYQNYHAVVYRGTDHTLVGWKEDLNLSFIDDLPGQKLAYEYLKYAAANTLGPLFVCGHSKGGNLAVYASSTVTKRIQKRITGVYNYDGPGFMQKFLEKPGYLAILPLIHTLVPQSSVVGMLLEHEEPYHVVKSSNVGITQHEPYSWEVLGPSFLKDSATDSSSRVMDTSIRTWLSGLSREEREAFSDSIHKICSDSNAESLKDLTKPASLLAMAKTWSHTDETTRNMIIQTLTALGKAMGQAMSQEFTNK